MGLAIRRIIMSATIWTRTDTAGVELLLRYRPLKCKVNLQFPPARVIEDPASDIYCKERTFTRQNRPLDPSTAGRLLRLKKKASALWGRED